VIVTTVLSANGVECARGEVVAVRVPDAVVDTINSKIK
jgi:hypothetical protein